MNIVAVRSGTVEDFVLGDMVRFTDADLLLLGFGVVGRVDYEKELNADAGLFYDLALLSKNLRCVIVAACDTDLYGIRRKSALVFENGRVLGTSDMNRVPAEEGLSPGYGYRIYQTEKGCFGVIIGEDVMFRDGFGTVAGACGDFGVAMLEGKDSEVTDSMLRAAALSNGLSIASLSASALSVFTVTGEIAERRSGEPAQTPFRPQCVYNELLCKCRGLIL